MSSIQNDEQILRIQSGAGINAFSDKHLLIGNKDKFLYKRSLFKKKIKDPAQQFPYAYVSANPVNRIDPKGLEGALLNLCKLVALYGMPSFPSCGCDDDHCKERQKELIQKRILLIDFIDATQRFGPDRETFIDINIAIALYNDEVKNHNKVCPNHQVPPFRAVGGRWMQ